LVKRRTHTRFTRFTRFTSYERRQRNFFCLVRCHIGTAHTVTVNSLNETINQSINQSLAGRPSRVAVVRYLQALKDSRSLAHPALTGGASKGTKRLVTSRGTPVGFGSTAIDCGTRTSTSFGSAGVVTMDLSNAHSPKVTSSKLRSRRPLRVYILPSNT
jgi:hypothetical protein